ncbi:hypothetical protein [Dickeya oryzae]|uniref:DUF4424 domain-containing protein n=1 Tax=Dickeya oryzae TaxID=1240404 RepID=A0AB39IDN4_9GAMM|nr:hypothetical protein [Dickeya oryzae]MCA6995554.1 hypothetical protein [Dickeya oryzae]
MIAEVGKWISMVIAGVIMTSTASAAEAPLKIRSVFDINSAFCAIKTNGVLGMDNRDSAMSGRGFGSASTNALLFLENGENDITLEIGALGWFSEEKTPENVRKVFNPNASCNLALTAFKGEQTKVLSRIHVAINKEGVPFAQTTGETASTTPDRITLKKIAAQQVEKGHVPADYFRSNYFPDGMELYQFTQKVYLKGLPEWKWTKATPFTGKPEQVQALKLAYLELWQLFATKNSAAIKFRLGESLYAWSVTTGENIDDVYNDNKFVEDIKNKKFEMIPIDWGNYSLEVVNNNKMVRFVNKTIPEISPLSYFIEGEGGEKQLGYFSPIFSLIDGKFIPVI